MAEKKCNNCGTNKNPASVPYVVHESDMARSERHTKALVWVIVLLIMLLVVTNAGWLWYESTMEAVVETAETVTTTYEDVEQSTDAGGNNLIGGDYVNGKAENR